jgi:hypothetical protein
MADSYDADSVFSAFTTANSDFGAGVHFLLLARQPAYTPIYILAFRGPKFVRITDYG